MKAPKNPNGKQSTPEPSRAIVDTPLVTNSTAEFLWEIQCAQLDKKDEEIENLKKELETAKRKIRELS